MKKTLISIVLLINLSCSENKQNLSPTDKITTPIIDSLSTKKIDSANLTKYNTVEEMLEDAHDFTVEQGTLKFINEDSNNLHVQVSKPIIKTETEKLINEIVKRDIIYVAFQAFAQTSIDKITITSIPIDHNDRAKYYTEYKKTITITRATANQIMENEFGTLDYSILFMNLDGMLVPSEDFSKLKFSNLDNVFTQLSN